MFKRILLLAACFAALPLPADAVAVGRTRNGYPLIIPQPQELKAAAGSFALPAELTVAAPTGLDLAPLAKTYAQTVKDGKVVPADGKATCRFEVVNTGVPESPEGYTLRIADDGVAVKARNVRGLYCGMQTLGWILRNRDTAEGLPNVEITDSPDLEMRGIYLQLPPVEPSRIDRVCHVIDTLGMLKYNTLLIAFFDNFPFSDAPFTKRKTTLSRADVAKIVAAAKRNRMEIIPKLQVLSHAGWLTNHRDWPKFYEGPARKLHTTVYCLSCPEVQPVVEQVVRETADLIKPRYFHLGLDEIKLGGFPMCPKCKAANLAELIAGHVRPIKKLLNDRGITPIVYQDDFFGRDIPGWFDTSQLAAVPDLLGKDIMINSWEYDSYPTAVVGKRIRKRGFEKLIYMSWAIDPDNCLNLPKVARELDAKGNILAYWSMVPVTLDRHDDSITNFYASTVIQANYCWNVNDAEPSRIPADFANVLRELLDGKPERAFRGKAAPLPISGLCGASFAADPLLPRFDAELAKQTAAIAAADPAKFALAAEGGTLRGIVLSGTDGDGFLRGPVTIPVGVKASGASFLMTAALFNSCGYGSFAGFTQRFPVGELKIVGDDGKTDSVKLVFQRSLSDWNRLFAGNACRSVVRGNDLKGDFFNFSAIDWRNPRPEVPIKEIVFSSTGKSGAAPALFAVSLSDASGTPQGVPGTPTADRIADRPAAKLETIADFAHGLPREAKPVGSGVPGFKCAVVDDTELGKVMEFTIPATEKRLARVLIDLPLKNPREFRAITFAVKTDNPAAIHRADFYVMDWSASHVLDVLGYTGTFAANRWQTVCLPRERFAKKTGGGIDPAKAECIRVAFFLFEGVKPTTIRIGNIAYSDRLVPGRVNRSAAAK